MDTASQNAPSSLERVRSIISSSNLDFIDRQSSPWWQQCQSNALAWLRESASPRELIQHVQGGPSGFDHRVQRDGCNEVETLSRYKWAMLKRLFPDFENALGQFQESPHSLPGSLVEIAGRSVSNVFLSHLEFFLFITKHARAKRVLEIGGGYGSLARIFCALSDATTYVIVDLPTSLLCAYVYLQEAFPDTVIEFVDSADFVPSNRARIVLIPSAFASREVLERFKFELAINTGSFQEMPADTCEHFQSLVFEELRIPLVYSHNYFLHAGGSGSERAHFDKTVVPHFPGDYHVAAATINNPVMDIDASSRNWLEVLLCRDAKFIQQPMDPSEGIINVAIEDICRKGEANLRAYLRAYSFITRFYFGGELRSTPGRGSTRSNLLCVRGAFPENLSDIEALRSWLNAELTEICQFRRRLNLDDQESEQLAMKERAFVAEAVDHFRNELIRYGEETGREQFGRVERKGLTSITPYRLVEYQRVLHAEAKSRPSL